jgi:hypothetical protein
MVGSGGLRKIRWAKEGRGTRGGVRVIYYWAVSSEQILMLFMYPKGEQDDLTSAQIKMLRQIVEEEYPWKTNCSKNWWPVCRKAALSCAGNVQHRANLS